MRYIAERYIQELEKPAAKLPTLAEIRVFFVKHRLAFVMGMFSFAMYSLLYFYNTNLTHIAQQTHAGHKGLFFVPIVVALVFSWVHGSFTSRFWDMLGIKAKTKLAS